MMDFGSKYDPVSFNKMYLSLLYINPIIIESQENAWKKMLKYSLEDSWGTIDTK